MTQTKEVNLHTFNFGEMYKKFLEDFEEVFTSKLRIVLGQKVGSLLVNLKIVKNYSNFDDEGCFLAIGGDDSDDLSYSLGKSTHLFRVEFLSYDTKKICLFVKVNSNDSTQFYLSLNEILSDDMILWCVDWLLTCTLHPDFKKRIEQTGAIDPIQTSNN